MSRKVEKINSDHCFAQNLILCGSGPIEEPQKNVAKMTYLCKARNEARNCETDNWVHFSNAIWSYLSHHTISNSLQTLCSFWISIALFCMYLARYRAPDSISAEGSLTYMYKLNFFSVGLWCSHELSSIICDQNQSYSQFCYSSADA